MATIAKAGLPLQFGKMYAGPLTDDQVFESYEAAEAYATGLTSYAGAFVSVKTTTGDSTMWKLYIVQDDKSLMACGDESGSLDDINAQITALSARIDTLDDTVADLSTSVDALASAMTWTVLHSTAAASEEAEPINNENTIEGEIPPEEIPDEATPE